MTGKRRTRTVAVVGAGASGALTTARLLEAAEASGSSVRIRLIDPSPTTGHGVAYATAEPRHLLNVPAGAMSARPDRPDDFRAWLADRLRRPVEGGEYVSRGHFGVYLDEHLAGVTAGAERGSVVRQHERVVEIARAAGGLNLVCASGERIRADAVVLATGSAPAGTSRPGDPFTSPRVIRDPWRPGALDEVRPDADVLLIGTGLTTVDVALALARPGRVIHAVSRHGLLPRRHRPAPSPVIHPPAYAHATELRELRRMVLRHASVCRRLHGDWRPAVDALRPCTSALWQRMSLEDRRIFLEEDLRLWEVHRHRLPPQTADWLAGALDRGIVKVYAGQVDRLNHASGHVRAQLSGNRWLSVGAVVKCTGFQHDVCASGDPLIRGLLRTGLARAGPLGLGLDSNPDGRLVPPSGEEQAPIWTVGALRRGNLWETTAIPEIRVQAAKVAALLASRTPTFPTAVEHKGKCVVPTPR
ncbi:FAD/NAD(P)-binding protein [Streptomyces sp. 147326]|uniref:FAD/NAD(P)-binding protein n=1 Tax=Streptomyces sp. 147326 TaxID=3074379 RepID=UPI0038573BCA